MGGWFLDVFVGYIVTLFRIILRRRRAHRARNWAEVSATIAGVSWQAQLYLPRPDAELVYTYRYEGVFYGGAETIPFYFEGSAKDYANHFTRGDMITIRVNPTQPEISIALDEDLEKAKRSKVGAPISS